MSWFISWLVPTRLSLSVSPQWREGCDGKEESEGESLTPFSLPITPCFRRARYAKTTGDESAPLVKRKNLRSVSDQLQTFLVLRKMQFDLWISSFNWLLFRESKTVLDSGFYAVDSGFKVLDSKFC